MRYFNTMENVILISDKGLETEPLISKIIHSLVLLLFVLIHNEPNWPRLSCRKQSKEGDEEADRANDGKTTSKSGMALNGIY